VKLIVDGCGCVGYKKNSKIALTQMIVLATPRAKLSVFGFASEDLTGLISSGRSP